MTLRSGIVFSQVGGDPAVTGPAVPSILVQGEFQTGRGPGRPFEYRGAEQGEPAAALHPKSGVTSTNRVIRSSGQAASPGNWVSSASGDDFRTPTRKRGENGRH